MSNCCAVQSAAYDIACLNGLLSRSCMIAFLIPSKSIGFTRMELSGVRISSLKGNAEDIIGRPQAIASIMALQQPSAKVGKTNISAAERYSAIRSC